LEQQDDDDNGKIDPREIGCEDAKWIEIINNGVILSYYRLC
jgi:hypothetical protein